MKTNIVMVCKDRHRLLAQSLDTLYANTPQDSFTLTLVDDESADFRTVVLIRSWCNNYSNCTAIRTMGSSGVISRAKNIGVCWSLNTFGAGDYLYLSDSDVYFTHGWLEKLIQFAQDTYLRGFRLWGGQIHPYHKPVKKDVALFDGEDSLEDYEILDGPSWLMTHSTLVDIGGFDRTTAPGPCQSEEYPFCQRLISMGHRIGVINPHVVIHTGLTNTNGEKAPGYDIRYANRVAGVFYE